MRSLVGLTGILTALALLALDARAQSLSLAGVVVDLWETGIPAAELTLTNSQTHAELTAASNVAGEYNFAHIPAGSYDLTVRAAGFMPYTRHNLVGKAEAQLEVRMQREKDETFSVSDLETQVAVKGNDYATHFNLARAYYIKGDLDNSVRQFQEALKLRPDDRAAKWALARVAIHGGVPAPGLQIAQELIVARPNDGGAMILAASAYLRMRQLDDAAEQIDKALKSNPYDTDALLESGTLNLQLKHYPAAETAFREAYRLDPASLRGLRGVAEVHIAMKEPEIAVQTMAAEVEKNPERTELRKELGLIEYRAKRFDKAIADLSSLLEKYKDSPKVQADLYAGIGECYQGKGDFPPAIENLKKATQLAPDSAPYFNVLASIYDAAGKTKEALTAYKAALKLDPQNALMMNNAAYLMAKSGGDLDEALRMVQVARRQLPDVAEILDTLGWIYLKKDLVSSACQVFQDLIEKAGNNPTYRYHYALALAKKGDKKAALEQLDLALKNQPAKAEEEQIRVLMKTLS